MTATSEQKKQKKESASNSIAISSFILAIAALLASGLTWYQNQVVQIKKDSNLTIGMTEIASNVNRLSDALNNIKKYQDNIITKDQLEQYQANIISKVANDTQQIDSKQQALQNKFEQIQKNRINAKEKFALQEVQHLLRLANQAIFLGGNTESSKKALTLAESILQQVNNPIYIPVIKKINQEIVLLENTKSLNIEKIVSRLKHISKSIPLLHLANEPIASQTKQKQVTEKAQNWRGEIKQAWKEVLGSISIQKVDQPPKPLLAPSERFFLNQNLQLNLTQAEFAVFRGDQESFNSAIQNSITWINDYFDLKTDKVQATLTSLKKLQKLKLNNTAPQIGHSYQMLQQTQGEK